MSTSGGLRKKLCRYICLGLLIAMAPLALSGCYGRFPLTKAVYRINGNVGDSIGGSGRGGQVVQSLVMWVMIIIPVYKVAMIVDVLVLNLIEFWTGNAIEVSSVQECDGIRVAFQSTADGREALLTVSRNEDLLTVQRVVKVSATAFEMRDASGKLNGMILKTPAGDIQLTDAQGRVIRTLAAADLAALPRIR